MQTQNSIIFYWRGTVWANQRKYMLKRFAYLSKTGNNHRKFWIRSITKLHSSAKTISHYYSKKKENETFKVGAALEMPYQTFTANE